MEFQWIFQIKNVGRCKNKIRTEDKSTHTYVRIPDSSSSNDYFYYISPRNSGSSSILD